MASEAGKRVRESPATRRSTLRYEALGPVIVEEGEYQGERDAAGHR